MRPDDGHLLQMLLAASDARELSVGLTRAQLDRSKRDQLALAKAVELVGEAASRVTEETRRQHPGIPWRKIIGMRHRLVHDYQNLNLGILWAVVQVEIPAVIGELRRIVPPEEEV